MLRGALNCALDFDYRVCDPVALVPITQQVEANVRTVMADLVQESQLDDAVVLQTQLACKLGGMGLTSQLLKLEASAVVAAACERRRAWRGACYPVDA